MRRMIGTLQRAATAAAVVLTMIPAASHARPTMAFEQQVVTGPPIALVGGNVVDVAEGRVSANSTIIVRGGRIEAIGPAGEVQIPADAKRVDMTGRYLMPGLINAHASLGLRLPGTAGAALANETDPQLVLRMADNARKTLLSGVTLVRLTSDRHGMEFILKAAIDKGSLPGPRIVSAGESISPTGGHGYRKADGPYEFAQAVRTQIERGATWIKIALSGGIADAHGAIDAAPMTDEELAMVVEVAKRNGAKVCAHNGSPVAAMQAMKFGIDSFEHGYFFTDEVLRQMKQKGVWLVPTIVVSQKGAMEFFQKIGSPRWYLERAKSTGESHWRVLQSAIKIGVPIALGTDQFPYEPNEGTTATIREAELYVEAGMKPIDALRAGTINAARMMELDDQVGSLKQGAYADIVALTADPIEDVRALRTLNFVMKNGRIYRDDARDFLYQ